MLTIRGESKSEQEEKKDNYYYRECRYGSFSRNIALPKGLNADKAEANLENGMLTLVIPKSEGAKPKAIKVKSKAKEITEGKKVTSKKAKKEIKKEAEH